MNLFDRAKNLAKRTQLRNGIETGSIGCALVTESGKVYIGVSLNAKCGIGFCAEQAAISQMLVNQEFVIRQIVAVSDDGHIISPCGKCRELMYQLSEKNMDTEVILHNKTVRLRELLPSPWM
ncbi:MAG: cytidine deaminase [Candidatus Altiarchaeota archaeon]|nr:cytidine deaminase [Candidatus Altiarchaeota archaeon]